VIKAAVSQPRWENMGYWLLARECRGYIYGTRGLDESSPYKNKKRNIPIRLSASSQ